MINLSYSTNHIFQKQYIYKEVKTKREYDFSVFAYITSSPLFQCQISSLLSFFSPKQMMYGFKVLFLFLFLFIVINFKATMHLHLYRMLAPLKYTPTSIQLGKEKAWVKIRIKKVVNWSPILHVWRLFMGFNGYFFPSMVPFGNFVWPKDSKEMFV
jgi:hypothetical protein